MDSHGIIVGCDRNQEWLLPWFFDNYSRQNSYPITFVDFGMTQEKIAWCKEKGNYLALRSSLQEDLYRERLKNREFGKEAAQIFVSGADGIAQEQGVREDQKFALKPMLPKTDSSVTIGIIPKTTCELWENHYGKGIWFCRPAWMKKPLALLSSPYPFSLWLDLDCQVKGPLEPLFASLGMGIEIALVREDPSVLDIELAKGLLLPGEINYNSGVIAFQKDAPILQAWLQETRSFLHIGDQHALNRAIFLNRPHLLELPNEYNWVRHPDLNNEAIIHHFIGGKGKIELLKQIHPFVLD